MGLYFIQKWFVARNGIIANVFIGGVGSVFTTAAILANKLVGVVEADILDFQIDADENVTFRTDKAYGLQPGDFLDAADKDKLKFFIDRQGFFNKGIGNDNLRSSDGLKFLDLPNCGVEASSFVRIDFLAGANELPFVIIPKVTAFSFEDVSPRFSVIILNSMFDGNTTDLGYLRIKREADNNANQEIVYRTNETKPNRIAVSSFNEDAKGATYFNVSWDLPAPAAPTNNALRWSEVWFNGVWMQINEATNFFAYGLAPDTDYNLRLYARDNMANRADALQVNVRTPELPAVFEGLVAYYPFNETSGNALDLVAKNDATLEGTITRDGTKYTFGSDDAMVTLPDSDVFTYTDGSGNIVDGAFAVPVCFDAFNASGNAWIVSKREFSTAGIQEYQLIYSNNRFAFFIWDENDNRYDINPASGSFPVTLGDEYVAMIDITDREISLVVNNTLVGQVTIPAGIKFFNGSSPVEVGNASFGEVGLINLIGSVKAIPFKKGTSFGGVQGCIDFYNNGNYPTL